MYFFELLLWMGWGRRIIQKIAHIQIHSIEILAKSFLWFFLLCLNSLLNGMWIERTPFFIYTVQIDFYCRNKCANESLPMIDELKSIYMWMYVLREWDCSLFMVFIEFIAIFSHFVTINAYHSQWVHLFTLNAKNVTKK